MGKGTALVAALPVAALAISLGAGWGSAAENTRAPTAKGFRLELFDSCGQLVDYARDQTAGVVTANGLPYPPAPPRATQPESRRVGVDYSTTNVQEEGIDEPDVVKTNGRHLFAVVSSKLHAVAVRARPQVVDTLELGRGSHQLLLRQARLLVLTQHYTQYRPRPGGPRYVPPYEHLRTALTEVDVASPGRMRVVRTLTIEGHYVTARLHDGVARVIVLSSVPHGLQFRYGELEENRAIVRRAPLANWLPRYELRRRNGAVKRRYLVQCRHVWRPRAFSGLGLLTVLTIDLDSGLEPVNTVSLLSDGQIAYASPSALYVTTERWLDRPELRLRPASGGAKTAVHKFGISSPSRTRYRASGFVPGFLLSQWSLSEHEDVLRVASTDTPIDLDARQTVSGVSTLEERDGRLVHLARVGGLGRGERIFAVRFIGEVGYVVTFQQVDPLYTLDLANPREPKVLGELKIPGWSSYLHPVGEDLVLGVGQDADDRGVRRGLQLSLFDVSNLRRPLRLHQRVVGGSSSAEFDHHAFLYWPPARLSVLPIQAGMNGNWFGGAIGVRVGRRTGIDEVGRTVHKGSSYVSRALVVGDSVYTVSDAGIEERDLRDFKRRGWAEFPRG
jgi:hypothetical protein